MMDYIHNTYSKDMYLSCYKHTVEPINSEHDRKKTGITSPLPSLIIVQHGRSRKKKISKNDVSRDQSKLRRKKIARSRLMMREPIL